MKRGLYQIEREEGVSNGKGGRMYSTKYNLNSCQMKHRKGFHDQGKYQEYLKEGEEDKASLKVS